MKFGMKGSDKQKILKFEQVKAVSEGKKVTSNLHPVIHVEDATKKIEETN